MKINTIPVKFVVHNFEISCFGENIKFVVVNFYFKVDTFEIVEEMFNKVLIYKYFLHT